MEWSRRAAPQKKITPPIIQGVGGIGNGSRHASGLLPHAAISTSRISMAREPIQFLLTCSSSSRVVSGEESVALLEVDLRSRFCLLSSAR